MTIIILFYYKNKSSKLMKAMIINWNQGYLSNIYMFFVITLYIKFYIQDSLYSSAGQMAFELTKDIKMKQLLDVQPLQVLYMYV